MKQLLSIVAILLTITSCNREEFEDISNTSNNAYCVINATIEQECQTRSSINYFGSVSWTDDDYIGVFGKDSQNVKFHFVQNESGNNSFWGNFDTEKEDMLFAYYPYQSNVSVLSNSITYDFPDTQTYHSANKAPMFGKVVSDKIINFYQTGGVLSIKVIGAPESVAAIQLSSNDNSPLLSGEVVISDITGQNPTFKIDQGKHSLKYTLSEDVDFKSIINLHIPLQVGYYEKLYVTLLNGDNSIYKELSLSNLEIKRGVLVNTKTINCSDKLYYQILPEEAVNDTDWDYAMMTSTDAFITWKSDDNTTIIAITNLRNLDVITITTDSNGNIANIFNNSEYISIIRQANGSASAVLYNDNGIEVLEDIIVKQQIKDQKLSTRAGVDQIKVISTIKEGYDICTIVNANSDEIKMQLMDECVRDIADKAGVGPEGYSDEFDLAKGIVSSKGNPYGLALEVGVYAESKVNKSNIDFYNKLCGATITNIEPTIINGQIRFGYSVRNTSNIPSGKLGYDKISRKCFSAIKKVPNGAKVPSIMSIITTTSKYGEKEIINDTDEYFYIPFEKGYTYYIISRISLSTKSVETDLNPSYAGQEFMHTVTYTSDMSYISADNIGEIEINEIKYENNQVIFDFNIWGEFVNKDNSRNWGVDLYHNGSKIAWESIYPLGLSGFRCVLKLNRDAFDCNYEDFKATAKGKWQLGSSIYVDGTTSETYSQLVDFDKLVYDTYPSLIFINPIIQRTEIIQTRSSDDDDSEKYITFFSYGIKVKGGFWFKQYTAKSDTEGPIASLSSIQPPSYDGEWAYDYSWTYSKEKPISPTLWYEIILNNGKTIQSANNLKFSGCPIDNIDYEDSFWEASSHD